MTVLFPVDAGTVVHVPPCTYIVFGGSGEVNATYVIDDGTLGDWSRGLSAAEIESAAWSEYARHWGEPTPRARR